MVRERGEIITTNFHVSHHDSLRHPFLPLTTVTHLFNGYLFLMGWSFYLSNRTEILIAVSIWDWDTDASSISKKNYSPEHINIVLCNAKQHLQTNLIFRLGALEFGYWGATWHQTFNYFRSGEWTARCYLHAGR